MHRDGLKVAMAVTLAGVLMIGGKYVEVTAGESFNALMGSREKSPGSRRGLGVSSGAMI